MELVASWGTIPEFPDHILPDDCWALRRGRAYAFGLKPIQFPCDHVHHKDTPYFCLPIIAHGETIGLMHIVFDGFEEGGLMRHMRAEVLNNSLGHLVNLRRTDQPCGGECALAP